MSGLLIFKSVCRRGGLLVMLIALFAAILLCGSLHDANGLSRCGLAGGGSDACAVQLRDALVGDGLLLYADEDALRAAMQSGEVSMGIVLPEDLTARLAARDARELIRFLDTPTSVLTSLHRLRVTARLTEVYAPYLVSGALCDAGVERSTADMRAEIDNYLANDVPFRFTYETVAGDPIPVEGLGLRAVRGCIALLCFCLFGFFVCPFDGETLRRLSGRLGARRALWHLILPGACTVLLLTVAVTAAAMLLCDALFGTETVRLLPAAACYAMFLAGLGLGIAAFFRDAAEKALLLSVLTLLSVALCPIFFDLPAHLSLSFLRCLLPPEFYFFAEAHGAAWIAAVLVFLGALPLSAWRLCRPHKN